MRSVGAEWCDESIKNDEMEIRNLVAAAGPTHVTKDPFNTTMTLFSLKERQAKALKLDTKEDIAPLIKDLRESDDFTEIDFSGNTLGVEACAELSNALRRQTRLQSANFADIFTGRLKEEIPDALDHLLPALLSISSLHTVDLSDNAFGLTAVKPLVDFISSHLPLTHLYLHNNGLGPDAGSQIGFALHSLALKKTDASAPPLHTIICGRNRLENGSMAAWANALAAHAKICVVKMVQNGIRQEGIRYLLTEGLSACNELRILDLQDNTFTYRAGLALGRVLPKWPLLEELGISDCLLSAKGAVVLGRTLAEERNVHIKILRLQYNEIDYRGLDEICKAVRKLPDLELVELNGNRFSEDHDLVEGLHEVFAERGKGTLDELDDMEEEESEEEEDASPSEPESEEGTGIVRNAEEQEEENVPQEEDKDIDHLADELDNINVR